MRGRWMGWALLLALSACGNKETAPAKPGDAPAGTAAQPSKASPAPAGKATGPLASLSGVARSLNEGMTAFLGGKDAAAAFPGWEAQAKDADKLRADIKAAGGTAAAHVFMEFELIFEKAGKDVYYLRSGVHSTDASAVFVQLDGREPEGGKVEVSSQPFDAYTGAGAPFKEAAEAVLKMLQGPDCAKVPVATPQDVEAIAPQGPIRDDLAKGADAARRNVDTVCKAIAGLGSDKVRLRIDDQTYLAKDASGNVVGSIRGGFEAKPGKIQYSLGRFRALK